VAASYYDPAGANPLNAPYVAGVFTDAEPAGNPNNHWQALLDGFDTFNLRSRMCDNNLRTTSPTFWNVYTNIFGKICALPAPGDHDPWKCRTTARPHVRGPRRIGNNRLRQASAVILPTRGAADA
jgi:hypothetical protein